MSSNSSLVVLGHSRLGRLTRRCRRLLEAAAAVADDEQPRVVVFTGRSVFGRGEGTSMLAAWRGACDAELLADDSALVTAQNASRSLALLLDRGIERATIVCARAHAPRVSFLFGDLYAAFGVHCRVHAVDLPATLPALAWELGARFFAGRQLRSAFAELRRMGRG